MDSSVTIPLSTGGQLILAPEVTGAIFDGWDETREVCGGIVGHRGCGTIFAKALVYVPNLRPDGRAWASFFMGRGGWRLVERAAACMGMEVIGSYHTHLVADPDPSAVDYRAIRNYPEHVCLIWHAISGQLVAYNHAGVLGRAPLRVPGVDHEALMAEILSASPNI